jgi:hypothetical protein
METACRTPSADTDLLRLKEITNDILFSDLDAPGLQASVSELYSGFSKISGIAADSDGPDDAAETLLAQGRAISPNLAARCTLDYVRTAQFLRATHAAVIEAQKRFPDYTLEVVYAGCGPFAPLAIPLATQFTPQEIQFTLLDIHQRSLDSVEEISRALGVTDFVRAYVQCDATTYKHPDGMPLHIVVTETMQAALLNEPQVAIAMNLAPQIADGGILVPERIAIDACLVDFRYDPARADQPRIMLGQVAEITLESCRRLSRAFTAGANPKESLLPAGSVEIPTEAENYYLALLTTITVFGEFALGEYDSLLTYPIVVHDVGKIRGGMKIEFYYQFGAQPGFKCRQVVAEQ